ncbi:hypothetical protein FHT77_005843 [Rhizobium sp. BK181]|nr:hypothetical protein [Rhizobium sp. BK181]
MKELGFRRSDRKHFRRVFRRIPRPDLQNTLAEIVDFAVRKFNLIVDLAVIGRREANHTPDKGSLAVLHIDARLRA